MRQTIIKNRQRLYVVREFKFDGCAFGFGAGENIRTHPVGLAFRTVEDGGKADSEQILFMLTIEEAEDVHHSLGEMIALRKRQATERMKRSVQIGWSCIGNMSVEGGTCVDPACPRHGGNSTER